MESLCIRIPKKDGEKLRRKLIDSGIVDNNLKIKQDGFYLLIPVIKEIQGFDIEIQEFEELKKQNSLDFSPAYEQIGDIAIIDKNEIEAKKIADVLIGQNRIKTVLQAETPVSGEYRIREFIHLSGEKKTKTIYKENGCRYLIDVASVYFTPRLSTERMRIAQQIKDGDKIVDMFAGVGPFSILIAKMFPNSYVLAVDKNPEAIKYLKENIKLNKVKNIEALEGDAHEVLKGVIDADHVIMNLPHNSLDFINVAFSIVKTGGLIHFYWISHESDLFDGLFLKINEKALELNLKIIPINKRVVRPYAPYQYNVCIEFRI